MEEGASRRLHVRCIEGSSGFGLEQYASMLDDIPEYHMLHNNWPEFATDCSAAFKIAYCGSEILLKFYVRDDYFQSVERPVNSAVNKDNCVEFFIGFDSDDAYYNIEFNCLGIGKVGYGRSRLERTLLAEDYVRKIKVWTQLSRADRVFNWEMTLTIPVGVFCFHEGLKLNEQRCEGNFYKCGDDLPKPHYLTWNTIASSKPDFHCPGSFGEIVFDEASVQ